MISSGTMAGSCEFCPIESTPILPKGVDLPLHSAGLLKKRSDTHCLPFWEGSE